MAKLTAGVWLSEGKVRAKRARLVGRQGQANVLELVLAEGKNREIRRMLAKLGHKVMSLNRVAVGPISVKGLSIGECRSLSRHEVELLWKVANGVPVSLPRFLEGDSKSRRPRDPNRHPKAEHGRRRTRPRRPASKSPRRFRLRAPLASRSGTEPGRQGRLAQIKTGPRSRGIPNRQPGSICATQSAKGAQTARWPPVRSSHRPRRLTQEAQGIQGPALALFQPPHQPSAVSSAWSSSRRSRPARIPTASAAANALRPGNTAIPGLAPQATDRSLPAPRHRQRRCMNFPACSSSSGPIQRMIPILENVAIARDTFRLRLGDAEMARAAPTRPVRDDPPGPEGATDPLLGRPLALYDVVCDTIGHAVGIRRRLSGNRARHRCPLAPPAR